MQANGPCVDRRGVNAIVVLHLDNWRNPLACTVSNQDDRVHEKGEMSVDSQMARKRGLICEGPKLLHMFNSVYLIN